MRRSECDQASRRDRGEAASGDPNARNDGDETPLFYAFKAGKRSDIAAMVGVLVAGGADSSHANAKGATPAKMAKRMRRPDKSKIAAALESRDSGSEKPA